MFKPLTDDKIYQNLIQVSNRIAPDDLQNRYNAVMSIITPDLLDTYINTDTDKEVTFMLLDIALVNAFRSNDFKSVEKYLDKYTSMKSYVYMLFVVYRRLSSMISKRPTELSMAVPSNIKRMISTVKSNGPYNAKELKTVYQTVYDAISDLEYEDRKEAKLLVDEAKKSNDKKQKGCFSDDINTLLQGAGTLTLLDWWLRFMFGAEDKVHPSIDTFINKQYQDHKPQIETLLPKFTIPYEPVCEPELIVSHDHPASAEMVYIDRRTYDHFLKQNTKQDVKLIDIPNKFKIPYS